ncbi:hypothetical protein FE374_14710 [Georgenia yuyongxinii]|uniref:SRPBCC family protein n=1 Tax=Georgenia yuyongxinii TaxID=2589797 RepID=A0A5B8C590_9MICO|nr:hypothetical protein [Georgenia yuyongxinii]QDC25694.1 hypothetical protein FE374_14710 [Georgenia yuyongxinii]
MPADDPNAHIASVQVAVPHDVAFEFMSSGLNQKYWALGSWNRQDEGDGVFSGTSLWDGSKLFIKLKSYPELGLVDFYTGTSPDGLRRLVQARIVPGAELGRDPETCVITLVTWRGARPTDEAWQRTYHAFKTEVHLIKGRLENTFPEALQ